jgi:RNA polymerase sigma factor (sigma-70 family)
MLRQIRRLTGVPAAAELSDAEALERFARRQDEGAFTALVRRHGPMVLGVCRRVLGNVHDAEDAFQATFLILARKAGSISKPEALVGWLYEVARRTAERARASARARRYHERRAADVAQTDFIAAVAWRDLQPVLDEEVGRLPEKLRVPFVLCYLQGRTYERVAAQLKCLPGSVSRRLSQARALLRVRLTRRGLALPAGVLTAALSQHAAPAALPAPLAAATVKAAQLGAAGTATAVPSAHVAALVDGGLRAMTLTKTRLALLFALTLSLLGLGLSAPGGKAEGEKRKAEERTSRDALDFTSTNLFPAFRLPPSAFQEMTVTGRVLDAAGKPVPGARVAVMGRRRWGHRAGGGVVYPEALAQGRAGGDGRFRLAVPRTAKARFYQTYALALAEGHGLGLEDFDPDAASPDLTVRLSREQVVRGRFLDLQGVPAAGVQVRVSKLGGPHFDTRRRGHIWFGQAPTNLAAWPAAAPTDADGRFTLRGVPPNASLTLQMDGDRFALQRLVINPDELERAVLEHNRRALGIETAGPVLQIPPPAPGKPLEIRWSLAPPRVLEGTVVYADTGKPVPQARLVCGVSQGLFAHSGDARREYRTDAAGRFRILADRGDHFIFVAYPPTGTPYLLRTVYREWPAKNVSKLVVNIRLPRGVLVRGKITEQPSGKPVAGASVEYVPQRGDNALYVEGAVGPETDLKQLALSDAGGNFAVPVLPGPGHLLVNGPTPDYLHAPTTEGTLDRGKDGGQRYYPDALVKLDLKPQKGAHAVAVTLRRGVTLTGRVVGPDGKPARGVQIFYRSYIPQGYITEPVRTLAAPDGNFTLPGLDPDRPQPVFFLDAERQLGARVELPAKASKGPLTVRLQRCGSASVRVLNSDGRPVVGLRPLVEVILTPGAHSWVPEDRGKVSADYALMVNLDRARHNGLKTDKEGRVTLPTLIPGAPLRLLGNPPGRGTRDLTRSFTVQAGQTLDLKDVSLPIP